ncbi:MULTISPECIES: prepilin-type N-terminal cleavage/methylation domain-containing protein [Rhodomicrobium]|uniref:prepilin-type N-terminal cleavage/methylation domain-containing protein n=1 Tax=Rhodomicrobium TaxID=1068 RepID=UPI000B4B3B49|nr:MULTISPECIES: prepilin-type N-terminal cleavage/methylation domain-containing protein [Rhodomicrobium]
MRRRGGDGQAGFTLVELLISLVILSLILSLIPATLRIGRRVWETDDAFERRQGLDSFRRYVEQRLTEALPIHLRDRARGLRIEFSGEPGRLSFVAPAAAGPGGGGVYRFELTLGDAGSGKAPLVLRQSLYRIGDAAGMTDAPPAGSPALEHRSHEGVAGFALRYFGPPEPNKPGAWHAEWPRRDALPDLVELSFTLGGPSQKIERSIVPLRLKDGP